MWRLESECRCKILFMKIAIVKLSALGDIIHAMVVLQFIKNHYPKIEIDWVVEKDFKELLESHPDINKVHVVNIKNAKKKKSIYLLLNELRRVRKFGPYDLVIDLQGLIKSALITRMISADKTFGFDKYSARESLAANFYKQTFNFDYDKNIVERNIALISFALKILGADDDAFKPIVAGGSNSALPHAVPSDRKLQKGDFLILDFGAKYNGYNSDMTRTVVIKECSDHQKEIYDIVYESQKLGINASSDSIDCKYLDYVCRNYIELNGFGDKFIHNTGHGLGLAVHENPRFSKNSNEKIYTDYVMTIEPGVYIEGFGGVRIEDDVLIKKSGCEVLNKSQKDLLILD